MKKSEGAHHAFVRHQRAQYYSRKDLAVRHPEDYISVIVDGADQAAYCLPYFHERTHASAGDGKIPARFMGALVHGRGAYAYTCLDDMRQGNNVTIQALHDCLAAVAKEDGPSRAPHTLFVQVDNTTKQCKGRFLMGWLGYLVLRGVFAEVYASFLPVGHTHEDVDQWFGCLARHLRSVDAPTMDALLEAVRVSYTERYSGTHPRACQWESVANISEWIGPHMCKITNITDYHQFRFTPLRVDGEVKNVRFHQKLWSGDQFPWHSREGKAVDEASPSLLFKTDDSGKVTVPWDLKGVPPAQRRPPCTVGKTHEISWYFRGISP